MRVPRLYFEYMVVYTIRNGSGRLSITTRKRIKTYADVEQMDQTVKDHNGFTEAFVVYYKLTRMFIKLEKL